MNAVPNTILDEVKSFQTEVIDESQRRPVAVDFWAAWCGPCRILGPILEKLAAEFQGAFLLVKVNTEVQPELAERFQIRSIPHVKIFKQGRVVDELTGAVSESHAREFLRCHCPSAADRKCEEGMELLRQEKFAEARKIFESALELQPAHAAARLSLGSALAGEGRTEEAVAAWELIPTSSPLWEQAQILKQSLQFQIVCTEAGGAEACRTRAASNPADLEARYTHACCLAAARNERAALEEFLFVVSRDKNFRAGAARKAMLTIFALVGERSELAEEYRKRLALVLF